MKIRTGDTVKVISGKERGKTGKVEKTLPKEGKVVVSGVNVVKRHMRPAREREGGIVEKTLPIDASCVMLLCPQCEKLTRVGYKVAGSTESTLSKAEGLTTGGDKKWRVCKKCGAVIE